VYGPARHVLQGTTDDNPACNGSPLIVLPFEITQCPICLQEGQGKYTALSLGDFARHLKEKHASVPLKYECGKCHMRYVIKHAALCHIGKCTGPKEVSQAHKCPECTESFATKIGLGQHKRHRHPVTRNEERAAPTPPKRYEPRMGSSFTAEEIATMHRLERVHRGDSRIAVKMGMVITTKSLKQLRDKRREPACQGA
jgi:hypothetical protein